MTTRRDFLKFCTALPAASLAPSWAFAAGSPRATNGNLLILLRLGGGNDGLNTVVPADDDRYRAARPTLRVDPARALRLADGLWLHRSLGGLRTLWDAGQLAIAHRVGYPQPDRSHFRSMDVWHTGSLDETRRKGFLAPLVDAPVDAASDGLPAVALVEDQVPLALIGERAAAPLMRAAAPFRLDDPAQLAVVREGDGDGGGALATVLRAQRAAFALEERVRRRGDAGDRFDGLPPSALGRAFASVLTLLHAGIVPRVCYLAHDGFDTHAVQGDVHAALLKDLGDSIAAFFVALPGVFDRRRVLLLTFSEFGRRVAENGSRGTDHGAAAPLFVAAGGPGVIAGGELGERPDLGDLEDGDVRLGIDFRRVYATLLDSWLGLDSRAALGGRFAPLPIFPRRA